MSNVMPMPTVEDWERVETINAELAVKVINLLHERDVLIRALDEIVRIYTHETGRERMAAANKIAKDALGLVSSPKESSNA